MLLIFNCLFYFYFLKKMLLIGQGTDDNIWVMFWILEELSRDETEGDLTIEQPIPRLNLKLAKS